jgi:lysozyme
MPARKITKSGTVVRKRAGNLIGSEGEIALWRGEVPLSATVVVKRIESFFSKPYDDNGGQPGGTWTIGYGSILDANDRPVSFSTPAINEARAEALLTRDMAAAAAVGRRVKIPLLVHEAAALISWTYNLGEGNLAKSALLTRINSNDKAAVSGEMRKWILHEGKPLVGLLRRRWAEGAICMGIDPINACVRAWREIDDLSDWPPIRRRASWATGFSGSRSTASTEKKS